MYFIQTWCNEKWQIKRFLSFKLKCYFDNDSPFKKKRNCFKFWLYLSLKRLLSWSRVNFKCSAFIHRNRPGFGKGAGKSHKWHSLSQMPLSKICHFQYRKIFMPAGLAVSVYLVACQISRSSMVLAKLTLYKIFVKTFFQFLVRKIFPNFWRKNIVYDQWLENTSF